MSRMDDELIPAFIKAECRNNPYTMVGGVS
jgi:hypothetical protein